MLDIQSYFQALKASWVKRYLLSVEDEWSLFMRFYINYFGSNNLLLHMNFDRLDTFPSLDNIPKFYQEMILAFNKSKNTTVPENHEQLMQSVIWGNKNIMIKSNQHKKDITLYYESWIQVGLIYVKDLLIIDGKISDNYIFQKLNRKVNFLSEKYKVSIAMRKYRHLLGYNVPNEMIFTLPREPILPGNENILVSQQPSKFYYTELVKKKSVDMNLGFWTTKLLTPIPDIQEIMKKKIVEIKEKKIAEFNYKFVNNIVACGKMLSKWKPFINEKCDLCNEYDTQCHIIFECSIVRNIWHKISNNIGKRVTLNDITFGITLDRETNNLVSQICYTIHKYWIMRINENIIASEKQLTEIIVNDLRFKSSVMSYLKENKIASMYKTASDWIGH